MKRFGCSWIALFILMQVLPVQAHEKIEKSVIKISLTYHQQNDALPILRTSAKTKKGKKFEPVEGVDINLFLNEESAKGFVGRITTNNNGTGYWLLADRYKNTWNSLPNMRFIATLTGNERFEDQSVEIEITKAQIELTLKEEDSVRTIHAKVLTYKDGSSIEVPETEIKLVVRRLLSDLPASEEEFYTTDGAGEVSAEFKLNIPGDTNGDIVIGAKIEDHEMFGSVVTTKVVKWGLPLEPDKSFENRTLWATRDKTPLWLLIFPNLIIASVWGIIFYLIYQISRIIKLGKTGESV